MHKSLNMINKQGIKKISQYNFADSVFSHLVKLPQDSIFGLLADFAKDTNPKKISLSAGTYKDDDNKPFILNCVRKAQEIHLNKKLDMEYLPIEGLPSFINNSLKIAYTDKNKSLINGEVAGIQALSGTGALYLGMKFLADNYKVSNTILIPDPTWPNHQGVAALAGLKTGKYRYYDNKTSKLDLNGFLEDLEKAPNGTIVLLHSCAHNPTGMDPNQDQWKQIFNVLKKKQHLPFFDNAYQGFASGDLDKDAWVIRNYSADGNRMLLAQSYAKNFGMYGQRVGCFSMICQSKEEADTVMSYLKLIARRMYSNPPKYGAQIVDIVLTDPALYNSWKEDLVVMSSRLISMRLALHKNLVETGSKINWDHIKQQIGMFAYTGLTKDQVLKLRKEESIYFTDDGRISISGLNTKNVKRVAECFHNVTKH
jgi:aspartate aminotransferase